MKMPDLNKQDKVLNLYSVKREHIELNNAIETRALEVQRHGLKPFDSLHFASAEYRNVDILLTVDKNFIKHSKRINTSLRVENPIKWFMEVIDND
jgi:predicted nucleic acid-binding protein